MRTLPPQGGQRPGQRPQPIDTTATNVAPIRQQPAPPAAAQPRQAAQAPRSAAFGGGGLPPPPAGFDPNSGGGGGGGFVKRDDDYWRDHPLFEGTHHFTLYVNKIKWWGLDGYSVDFRVTEWDRATNRSGDNHGRPIAWQQSMMASKMWEWQNGDEKAGRAYGHFRHRLVTAYAACGWPEERWEVDDTIPQSEWQVDPRTGQKVPPRCPPWHQFFVHQLANGLVVPVVLAAEVVVERGREKWPEVRRLSVVTDSQRKVPFEAPLPYEVPPAVAAFHRWEVKETRTYTIPAKTAKNGYQYDAYDVEAAVLSQVQVGQVGLPTYKDL